MFGMLFNIISIDEDIIQEILDNKMYETCIFIISS